MTAEQDQTKLVRFFRSFSDQRLRTLLALGEPKTVEDISSAFGITAGTVRDNVNRLYNDGLLELVEGDQRGRNGRAPRRYVMSPVSKDILGYITSVLNGK